MARAAGVVAMGGYNTFCEILSFDKPALVVPRVRPRLEQAIRAGGYGLVISVDNGQPINNLLQLQESPTVAGRYLAIDAPEFQTHSCGQIVRLDAPPTLDADQLESAELSNYDSVLLCNVGAPAPGIADALTRYVREGGGIAYFAGSELSDVEAMNRALYADGAGILPLPLERVEEIVAVAESAVVVEESAVVAGIAAVVTTVTTKSHVATEAQQAPVARGWS